MLHIGNDAFNYQNWKIGPCTPEINAVICKSNRKPDRHISFWHSETKCKHCILNLIYLDIAYIFDIEFISVFL